MKAFSRTITLVLLTFFVGGSFAFGYSYRKNRKHKGFKSQKKNYKIKEVKKKAKKKLTTKKRRPIQLQVFERFAQERLQQKTAGQIQTLLEIIGSTPAPQRADLYFRLAEHYWENSKYYDFIGHKYDDFRGRPSWPEKARLQQQSFAKSKVYKKKAALEYFKIIKSYPNYKNLCQAYYFLGKNLFEMGQEKQALGVFNTMIKRFGKSYPACPFIPNAYLAFGEHYFNNGAVRNAMNSYRQVLHYRNSSIYSFAMYKIGWCHYNLVQYRKSLKTFIQVVNHARKPRPQYSSQGRRIQLLREALRDLVLAYSQVGSATDARNRFMQIGGEANYLKMLRNLGTLYRQQGKFRNVIVVYRDLMAITPTSPRVLYYQLYITQATDRLADKKIVIRETGKLVRIVKDFRKRGTGGAIRKEAEKEIRAQIKEFAQFRHYEGQKTRDPRYYEQAIAFYRHYLSVFGTAKESYEMHFWLGELLFKLKRYDGAAKEYTYTLNLNPKGKYSKDAGYNTILAFNKLMKQKRMDVSDVRWRKKSSDLSRKPMPTLGKRFLKACANYIKYFPKGKRAIDVAYKAAQMFYRFNHMKEALPRFYFLVKNHPRHDYAMFSAHYILDTYNLKKRWADLNRESWRFYKEASRTDDKKLGNNTFKKEVRSIIIQSGIKICRKIEKEQKKHCDAAKCFMKFANEFPDNKRLASLALFNASVNEYKCKRPEKALAIRQRLIERYPRSKYVKQSILDLADIYANRADFAKAAKFYSKYTEKYPRDPNATKARIQTALFREVLGETDKAMSLYRKILGDKKLRRSDRKKYAALYFRLAKLEKKQGQWRKYSRMMQIFDKKQMGPFPQRLEARYEHAVALQRLGSRRKAGKILASIPRSYDSIPSEQKKKFPRAGFAAAHVRFLEAEELFKDYTKIKLSKRFNQRQMKKALDKKKAALKKTLKAYERVVKYKQGAWGVAALYRAGDMYLNYSKFLLSAPIPDPRKDIIKTFRKILSKKGLPRRMHSRFLRKPSIQKRIKDLIEQTKMKLKMALQDLAQPQEDEAVKLYKRCLGLGHSLRVYNKWTNRSLAKLRRLKPYEFPKSLETGWALRRAMSGSDFLYTKQIMGEIAPAPAAPPAPPAAPTKKISTTGKKAALLGARR